MKKIRVLILLLVIILITGCSGTYNLTIDKDLKVKEEAELVLENEISNRDSFNSMLDNKLDKDDYTLTEEGNNLKLTYKQEYSSIEDYLLNSYIYKQLFDSIQYNIDSNEVSFETSNIFNLKNSNLNNANKVNLLQINITTPLKVTDENSDSSNENTYSWTLNNKTQEKGIRMVFNLGNNRLNIGTIIIISVLSISVIIIVIIIIKRLLEARKI